MSAFNPNLSSAHATTMVLAAALAIVGCADGNKDSDRANAGCVGAKCDSNHDGDGGAACNAIDNSGSDERIDVFALDDDLSRTIGGLGERCDLTVGGVVAALRDAGCGAEESESFLGNHSSVLVSERSQRFLDPENSDAFIDYRSVTSLDCSQGRVFLHYPLSAQKIAAHGSTTEYLSREAFPAIIADNRESGTLNYYQAAGDTLIFFGSSLDLLKGTDIDQMAELLQKGTEEEVATTFGVARNCAACHPGGGLLMKELESPWVHWEDPFVSPGATELIDSANDIMGAAIEFEPAATFEEEVREVNARVNLSRAKHMIALAKSDPDVGIGDLLRPAFCSDEFNIGGTSIGFGGENFDIEMVPAPLSEALVDIELMDGDPIFDEQLDPLLIPVDTYDDALAARGSTIDPRGLLQSRGSFRETVGTLTFMHRAAIDTQFLQTLASELDGVFVEFGFPSESALMTVIKAIRGVDFTRSLYSEERCALVSVANEIDPKVLEATEPGAAIRDALIAVLDSRGTLTAPEQDLRAGLVGDLDIRASAVEFARQCQQRHTTDPKGFVDDYLEAIAQVRKRGASQDAARKDADPSFLQFRFPGMFGFSMPVDDKARDAGTRLHAKTCTLTKAYVPLIGG